MPDTDLSLLRDGSGRSLDEAQAADRAWREPYERLARWQDRTGIRARRLAGVIRTLSTSYVALLGVTAFHLGLNWGPAALFGCLARYWPVWLLGTLCCLLLEGAAVVLRKAAVRSGHLS